MKKRVDQNEEGVNRALDVLDNLAQQIKNLKDEVDEHKIKTREHGVIKNDFFLTKSLLLTYELEKLGSLQSEK